MESSAVVAHPKVLMVQCVVNSEMLFSSPQWEKKMVSVAFLSTLNHLCHSFRDIRRGLINSPPKQFLLIGDFLGFFGTLKFCLDCCA